jgi:hypothetical protein
VPVDRNWTVPEDEQQKPEVSFDGEGNLLVTPRVVNDADTDSLVEAVLEAVAILRRVGGTIQIASQRGEIAPNLVVTESYIFAYHSFTPLVRRLPDPEANHEADDVDDVPEEGDVQLDERELEMHFPEGSPLAEVARKAAAEEPAEAEPAAAVE